MYYVNPELVNVVENPEVSFGNYPEDKLTLDELINKVKNKEPIKQGTEVHFDMHDIIRDDRDNAYLHETYIHIPTNTRIRVEYDDCMDEWTRTSLLLPGYSEEIWIGDDIEDCWWNATHGECTLGFKMNAFVEWT